MKYLLPVCFILVLLTSLQCARQTTPTGGPKDSIPPQLIQSIPPDKTVNFKSKTIELYFNEDVIINNPREQLLITPSIGNNTEMEARREKVIVHLNAGLQDSTTYTINFRESIQDITEKNPAKNLQLAFSTGSYIDSLSISGTINDLLTGKPIKDGSAALYMNADTFNIFKHKPYYLTKSDDEGHFVFNNLKPGTYYIYTFADKNKNIVVDSRNERYGFINKPVSLRPDSTYKYQIPVVLLDARELNLISAKPYNTYFNIKTSKSTSDYSIRTLNPQDSSHIHHIYGEDNSSIHVFLTNVPQDSIPIQLTATDSIGNSIDTTLYAKISGRRATPEKFNVTLNKPVFLHDQNKLQAEIAFNKPVLAVNYDSIKYQVDSTTIISFTDDNFTWNKMQKKLFIAKTIPPTKITEETPSENVKDQINKLRLGKAFFISIDGDTSQMTEQSVSTLKPETTGTILVQATTEYPDIIIQVLSQDYKVQQTSSDSKNVTFKNLPPGNYLIRLIIDLNKNNKWDPGNFFEKIEPEPIIYYTNDENELMINIKANWELGPLLISNQ